MLICIDAGHFLGTPGKRCLKSIDPNETREWVLNDNITSAETVVQMMFASMPENMRTVLF